MATIHPHPNIWAQMSYTPPRGPCAQKLSMLTTCPCHRFMIHPLKAATSFECDGCGHHASFHRMANEGEEAVVRGWRDEVIQNVMEEERTKKREGGRRRCLELLEQGSTKGKDGGDGMHDGSVEEKAKKKRKVIEGPSGMVGSWGGEEDEEAVKEMDEEIVRDLSRIREAVIVAENLQRREEKEKGKELERERERAREAETSGRGRKRKGR
ncbi:MAG: hypothetical protein OHK93_000684 [Ramalina farinacea]|uniref:Uncharacterized protein n=1 Tax=Ramalina farinacea TaxID=258253 RepID=A0AA43QIK0_9LECA|nr:hypothetical protein [Ramalina farinacea]